MQIILRVLKNLNLIEKVLMRISNNRLLSENQYFMIRHGDF